MRVALSFLGCHRRGGVERIVYECARFLARGGHDVDLYASEWVDVGEERVRYHPVPADPVPWFARGADYYVRASRMLARADFDVLNTHGCVCPTGGVHWVQSIQRAWLETSRRLRPKYSWGAVRQRLNPLHPVLLKLEEIHFRERRYRKVIATTPEIREDLHRLYDVPHRDVVVIPNGFAPAEFNPERRAALRGVMRAEWRLEPDDIALLFVANELPRKGYGTLLEAMRILDDRRIKLLVVGRSNRETAVREACQAGLEQQVIVCGSTGDVSRFHAAADLFVLPTQYEAFCLAILEALGSGLPVITTRVPGAQNAIQPGLNGELMDVGRADELAAHIRHLADPDRRREYSQRAPATARIYQWPTVLKQYEEILSNHTK